MTVRLAFVAKQAYPLFDSSVAEGIGGAEVRAVTFARGLRNTSDYEIQFVVAHRPNMLREANGIGLQAYQKRRGAARFIEKWSHSVGKITGQPQRDACIAGLEADIVLFFGVRNDTAGMVRAAKETGKQSVVFLTSDRNVDDARRSGRSDRGAYGERGHLCRYALLHADRVVCQTSFQQAELRRALQVDGALIRNPIRLDDTVRDIDKGEYALWVGRADTFSKRADLCLQLARQCPSVPFLMIMNNHHDETYTQLRREAPANVRIVERVPFDEVETFYQQAAVLVNTSAAEGFPNSFLQAGKFGKPVLSLDVDPAEMLSKDQCGIHCQGDLGRMATALQRLMTEPEFHQLHSRNISRYVRRHHDMNRCTSQLKQLLDQLVAVRSQVA